MQARKDIYSPAAVPNTYSQTVASQVGSAAETRKNAADFLL
jgi:hypothetical protein